MLNKDSIEKILNGSDDEYREYGWEAIQSIADYAQTVMLFKMGKNMINEKFKGDTKSYQDEYVRFDNARSNKHNVAIGSASMLNRIAENMGIDPVYPGDPKADDRGHVAHIFIEFAKEMMDADMYGKDF
jgi:flagellar basal body rod protein FlgC